MNRLLPIAGLLAILATPALAEDTPRGGPADSRVKFVEYQETQVYRIVGTFRTATQVVSVSSKARICLIGREDRSE